MKALNILALYRLRLRARLAQECLAILGIGAGVALLFASQLSSASLQSSVAALSRGIAGRATLQLLARDPHGFPQSVLARVRQIDGVRAAAPLLEADANASGPRGATSVQLIGADESLKALGGTLTRDSALAPFGGIGAIVLPAPLARRIGVVRFGQEATLALAGHTAEAPLYKQLTAAQIGPLISSPVALAPLSFAQEIAGLPGRVTRILVQSAPGAQGRVQAALRALAGGRLNVATIGYDEQLFAKAAAASNQSSTLFGTVAALVGFLFAFNAMLLTVPQRRRLIADLRREGYTPRTTIAVLLVDALALGGVSCVLGLALGEELSLHVLGSNPAFLSLAFALGSPHVVSLQSVALAVCGGMLAAIVAMLSPLRDVLARDPLAAIRPRAPTARTRAGVWSALAGLACLGAATLILLAAPDAAIPGMVLLLAALLLVLPLALGATLALARLLAGTVVNAVGHIATMELGAARARAIAIAATGATAVFGSVAIQGAHGDLLAGLRGATRELNAATDIWISPAGSYDLLKTAPFAARRRAELERLPGVRAVSLYRSGLLDYGSRRVLVIAPARASAPLLPSGQIVQGDARLAQERVRGGGWLVLSRAIAEERHLRVGDAFTLPSPRPESFRVAALSTNLGWAPGAVVMNADDYARAWNSADASAYSVLLAPGASPAAVAAELTRTLGPSSGLSVETSAHHTAAQLAVSHAALARLTQIATLIPIAAVLAMAAALGAMIWQRRPRLAKLRIEGFSRAALLGTIMLESVMLVGVGSLTGAIFGIYGQRLADRALSSVINFPVVHTLTVLPALRSLALVTVTALAILALPGALATRVSAALALGE
ncbi:MAG TPA: FtsX-like permease family protein [Solirubrobacteraceae bacterium]